MNIESERTVETYNKKKEKSRGSNSVLSGIFSTIGMGTDKGISIFSEQTRQMEYLSYSDIYVKSGKIAARLKKLNIRNRSRVILSAKTAMEFPIAWLALTWLGAVPIPVPPREAMVNQRSYEFRIGGIIPYATHYIAVSGEEEIVYNCVQDNHAIDVTSYEALFDGLDESLEEIPKQELAQDDDTAFIQYTSGSTSSPKGILVTHKAVKENIDAIWERITADPNKDKVMSWLPLYHDMGLVGKLLASMYTQTTLVMTSPQYFAKRPINFLNLMGEHKANICSMPNFALEWINRRIKESDCEKLNLSSIKWFGVGAEPININSINETRKILKQAGLAEEALSPCYGLAEATLGVTLAAPYENYKVHKTGGGQYHVKLGKVLNNVLLKIDNDGGSDTGIIKIKGPAIAKHALINGKKVKIVDDEGYYNTGDIGMLCDDELIVLGRVDEMFNINGENKFPYDIESVVKRMEGVNRNRVACFSILPDDSYRQELVLVYEAKKLTVAERESIQVKIVERVKSETGIHLDHVVDVPLKSIPVTPSGKIQRKIMKSLYQERLVNRFYAM